MNHKRKYSRSKSKSQEHEGIEEPLLRKLQRIEKSSDSGDDDDISANLLADADKILESLVKVAERDMKDVERAIYPKREELLAAMTQEVDQHVHKIKQHRQETLPSLEAAISGIKDIRDKLHSILEALDRDILALRSFSDQALLEEFEKIRSKETETLRKELLDIEAETSNNTSENTSHSKHQNSHEMKRKVNKMMAEAKPNPVEARSLSD